VRGDSERMGNEGFSEKPWSLGGKIRGVSFWGRRGEDLKFTVILKADTWFDLKGPPLRSCRMKGVGARVTSAREDSHERQLLKRDRGAGRPIIWVGIA